MNAQTVQDRWGWAPDIGGMVLYSVLEQIPVEFTYNLRA